jgi:hypothetical protein
LETVEAFPIERERAQVTFEELETHYKKLEVFLKTIHPKFPKMSMRVDWMNLQRTKQRWSLFLSKIKLKRQLTSLKDLLDMLHSCTIGSMMNFVKPLIIVITFKPLSSKLRIIHATNCLQRVSTFRSIIGSFGQTGIKIKMMNEDLELNVDCSLSTQKIECQLKKLQKQN